MGTILAPAKCSGADVQKAYPRSVDCLIGAFDEGGTRDGLGARLRPR